MNAAVSMLLALVLVASSPAVSAFSAAMRAADARAAVTTTTPVIAQPPQTICQGDTRGDRKCNHDITHRVCAKIGVPDTSFWSFTGQRSWCNTRGYYGGQHGHDMRCPSAEPTWCICKWATASWIKGAGCSKQIDIDCAASDVCATRNGLFFSYNDFSTNLKPARDCVKVKCKAQWDKCKAANPHFSFANN